MGGLHARHVSSYSFCMLMLECTLSQPQTKKSYYRHNFVMLLADAFSPRSHIQCTRTLYVCMAKDAQSLGTVWWFVHALRDYSNFEACFSSFKLVFAQQKQSLLGPGHTGETQLQFLHFFVLLSWCPDAAAENTCLP